jgi:hypothetical protein
MYNATIQPTKVNTSSLSSSNSSNRQVNLSDVNILNEIVKESKNVSDFKGGETSRGVRYSAAELQFYKDHISGVKGEYI